MSDEQTNEAANIIIAELKAQVEAQKVKIDMLQVDLQKARQNYREEQIKHAYLSQKHEDFLVMVLDKVR